MGNQKDPARLRKEVLDTKYLAVYEDGEPISERRFDSAIEAILITEELINHGLLPRNTRFTWKPVLPAVDSITATPYNVTRKPKQKGRNG